jgi:ABC-type transporter Mla subunit MlaD
LTDVPFGDLTPQLRTRLFRMERLVGLFVAVAGVLMLVGFLYYLYHTAERRGWFVPHAPYYTFVQTADGLKVGDPVLLMGFSVGEITEIEAQPPYSPYNVFVAFEVHQPYYGYVWADSRARIIPGDLLGGRRLEVTKGIKGQPTAYEEDGRVVDILKDGRKVPLEEFPKGVFIEPLEEPSITQRVELLVDELEQKIPVILDEVQERMPVILGQVQEKVPAILDRLQEQLPRTLDQLEQVLASAEAMVKSANAVAADTRPILANVEQITEHLRDPDGSLGQWLIPPELRAEIARTLTKLNGNLKELNRSLSNVSELTGNLRGQVESNDRILDEISSLVIETDELVKGLKRSWLFREAFDSPAPEVPEEIDSPLLAPPSGSSQ